MDPDIGGVLDAIHADPARAWSNAEMSQYARRAGYKSDAAFSRAFTRHHGRSPGQWRQEHVTG